MATAHRRFRRADRLMRSSLTEPGSTPSQNPFAALALVRHPITATSPEPLDAWLAKTIIREIAWGTWPQSYAG